MDKRAAVRTTVRKVAKWWVTNWLGFVAANGRPTDRLVGPAPWDVRK